VAKYCDHLPLYRQSAIYARSGVELERSTLADWVGRAAFLLQPLAEAIAKHARAGAVLHADDTPVPVLKPGRGKTKAGRLWVLVRDELPWGSADPPAAVYRYSTDRKREQAEALLGSCRGFLHADGYAGFNALYAQDPKTRPSAADRSCLLGARSAPPVRRACRDQIPAGPRSAGTHRQSVCSRIPQLYFELELGRAVNVRTPDCDDGRAARLASNIGVRWKGEKAHPRAVQERTIPMQSIAADPARISTGSSGLDAILGGGLDANRLYLYEGHPGTGKTTLALQFLLEGTRNKEPVLYISLSESAQELRVVAGRHGWTLDDIDLFELVPPETTLDPRRELTILHPAEMELSETTQLICDRVKAHNPRRVVIDSLSELRLLAQNPLRYRRQILALKHFFSGRDCTVVMLDDLSSAQNDLQLHSISHGVVLLEQLALDFGGERRRLRVVKMRATEFKGGFHDFVIRKGGLSIYPRLVAAEHQKPFIGEFTPSGNNELDALLGGGLERGTNALLIGAAGVGKSSLALTYAISAAARGERSVIFAFDEGQITIHARARTLGLPLQEALDRGLIEIRQIDPAEMSPGEFAHLVRHAVESDAARIVVIDSLTGYLNAMPDERFLILQMHELLTYLSQLGVLTILVLAQHGLVGPMQSPIDLSYLSDAVLMLRYFEAEGSVRRALSVVKKRSGHHEHTIREYRLSSNGIKIGAPLKEFSGILTGTPRYLGGGTPLMPDENAADA
jgi:circadian clock protein KaiC